MVGMDFGSRPGAFAEARTTLAHFVPNTPSTEVIEKCVLGFGRYTEAWLEQAPLVERRSYFDQCPNPAESSSLHAFET